MMSHNKNASCRFLSNVLGLPTQAQVLGIEFVMALLVFWILVNAIHRTDFDALGRLVMPHTLGAQGRVDLIDLVTLTNGAVGTFGLTHIAIDAFISDYQRHKILLVTENRPVR
jgi:hypothetical protein